MLDPDWRKTFGQSWIFDPGPNQNDSGDCWIQDCPHKTCGQSWIWDPGPNQNDSGLLEPVEDLKE